MRGAHAETTGGESSLESNARSVSLFSFCKFFLPDGVPVLVPVRASPVPSVKKRKKTDNPREGWEDGTPPPHRDFKERGVVR